MIDPLQDIRLPSLARPADSPKKPSRVESPHDARTIIEESIVWINALDWYFKDELTPKEHKFLKTSKKNLAVIYRRMGRASRSEA